MDDTITLQGTSPHTATYNGRTRLGNQIKYNGVSAANDLAGRPSFVVSNDITKAGIARASASLTVPLLDTVTGKYKAFTRANVSITQPTDQDIDVTVDLVLQLADALNQFAAELVGGTA